MGAAGKDSGCNSVKTEQQEEKTMEINIFNTNKKYDVIYADPHGGITIGNVMEHVNTIMTP